MNSRARTLLFLGILLIGCGVTLILAVNNTELRAWWSDVRSWPVLIVAAGGGLLLLGLLIDVPEMAIPASIVSGIGVILYYQNESGNWASWAYMWALIPGFVGIGILLSGLLGAGGGWRRVREGLDLMLTSLLLYALFAAIFIPLFGGPTVLGPYGPAALFILAGAYVILRGVLAARRRREVVHVEG